MEMFWSQVTTFILMALMTGSITGKEIERYQEAVTSLIGLENFYVEVKKRRPFTYLQGGKLGPLQKEDYSRHIIIDYDHYNKLPPPEAAIQRLPNEVSENEDLKDKSEICARVFGSPLFDMRGVEYVRFDSSAQNSGENNYKDFHTEMQESGGVWMNPYQKLTVVVGNDKFDEYVFRCITRKRESQSYVTYFISPIYQVWQGEGPEGSDNSLSMNGRFIFTTNEQQELTVHARAEEVALLDEHEIDFTMESNFRLRKHGVSEPETNNEICMLSVPDKIRLCAAVLGARPKFLDRIRFWPTEDNIEPCKKKKVVTIVKIGEKYKSDIGLPKKEKVPERIEMTYEEWMLGCKVEGGRGTPDTSAVSTYYVSLAALSYHAIVHKPTAEDLCIPYVGLRYVVLLGKKTINHKYRIVSYKPI